MGMGPCRRVASMLALTKDATESLVRTSDD